VSHVNFEAAISVLNKILHKTPNQQSTRNQDPLQSWHPKIAQARDKNGKKQPAALSRQRLER